MDSTILSDNVFEFAPMFLLRWEEPQQAYVVLYPEGVIKLNETGAAILRHCDGKNTIKEIATKLNELYNTDVTESVHKFMEVSYAKGWIRIKA